MRRYSKHCTSCGKHFIIPGTCADYLYKRGKLYYCGYNCWNHAEQQEPSQPEQLRIINLSYINRINVKEESED